MMMEFFCEEEEVIDVMKSSGSAGGVYEGWTTFYEVEWFCCIFGAFLLSIKKILTGY